MEATDEIAPKKKMKAALSPRLVQRGAKGLGPRHARRAASRERNRERNGQRSDRRHANQRDVPVKPGDEQLCDWDQRKLPERAGGGDDAKGRASLLGRNDAAENREYDGERGAREREADENTRGEIHR